MYASLPLLQSVIENGVVGAQYKDGIEPSLREEVAAVVLHSVASFYQNLFQLIYYLHKWDMQI